MRRRTGSRALTIIIALVAVWAGFLLLAQPAGETRGSVPFDGANIIWFPLIIVALFIFSRYLLRRNEPHGQQEIAQYGIGEAVASGMAWGLVKGVQEFFWYDALTVGPLVSGIVVFAAVLAGNWLVSRVFR